MPIIAKTMTNLAEIRSKLKWIFLGLIGLNLFQIIVSFIHFNEVKIVFSQPIHSLFEFNQQTNFYTNLFVFGIVGFAFSLIYYLFIKQKWVQYLLLVELFIFVPFVSHYTAIYDVNPTAINESIKKNAKPFNKLSLEPIKQHSRDLDQMPNLWATINVYLKNIDHGGYNSFYFSALQSLEENYPKIKKNLYKNPVVYLTNHFQLDNNIDENKFDSTITIVENKSVYRFCQEKVNSKKPLNYTVDVLAFNPEGFKFQINTNNAAVLNLLQSYYPGWEVYVDEQQFPLLQLNKVFMGVYFPQGQHLVEFKYRNKMVIKAAILSYAIWFLMIGFMFYFEFLEPLKFHSSKIINLK